MVRRFLPALVLFAPSVALAAGSAPTTFCALVKWAVSIINTLTAIMVLAALVLYLYNISSNLRDAGESRTKLRNAIMWGIIAMFVMVSVWGILHLLQDTLFPTQPPVAGAPAC